MEKHNLSEVQDEIQAAWDEFNEIFTKPSDISSLGGHAVREVFTLLGEIESPYEDLRSELEARVVEQPAAIDAIISALEQSHARLDYDNRPIANLAFLGPSGTGKTESARALAEVLSGKGVENLVKIDCSNFSRGHEVALLTGSPPGYVGEKVTPLLAKKNIEKPGTVVLFDEIEKGAPALHNLMLQIMDDGNIRLNQGEETNFRDTVVIMTSNLGAAELAREVSGRNLGFNFGNKQFDAEKVDAVARNSFKKSFRPEFINRLDEMIVFHPLSESGLSKVLDVKLGDLNDQYEYEYGIRLTLSEQVQQDLVATAAREPEFGARPLVRALEKQIQAKFGRYLEAGTISEGSHVHVYHQNEVKPSRAPGLDSSFVFAKRQDESLAIGAPYESFDKPSDAHEADTAEAVEG